MMSSSQIFINEITKVYQQTCSICKSSNHTYYMSSIEFAKIKFTTAINNPTLKCFFTSKRHFIANEILTIYFMASTIALIC